MWRIYDWAGNRKFPDREFATFEDGWEFIRGQFPDEEDWQEFDVIEWGKPCLPRTFGWGLGHI